MQDRGLSFQLQRLNAFCRRWLSPPVFPDDDAKTRRAALLNVVLVTCIVTIPFIILSNLISGNIPPLVFGLDILFVTMCLILRYWLRRGNVESGSVVIIAVVFVYTTGVLVDLGTVRGPTMTVYALIVIAAGILFDRAGLVTAIVVSSLAVLGLMWAETSGLLPRPDYSLTVTQWTIYTMVFSAAGGITFWAFQSLQQALKRADQEIAERKQMEEALRQSEEKFSKAFHSSPDAITISHLRGGQFVEVNEGFCHLSGYTREEVLSTSAITLGVWVNPQDRESVVAELQNNHRVRELEFDFRTKSGRIQHCLYSAEIIQLNGEAHLLSVVRDITERKQMEAALRESQELFSLFMQYSPVYAFIKEVTPTESRVLVASENYQDMVGIPGSKMVGKNVQELFPADFAAKISADDWEVVSRGKVLRLDEDFNGRHYTTIKFPIVRGDKTLLAGYTIDITERKRVEEQLRATNERLETLIRTSPLAIALLDVGGNVQMWNPAAEQIFGWTAQEVLGKPNPIVPDCKQNEYASLSAEVKLGKAIAGFETVRQRKDGSPVDVSISTVPINDAEGKTVGRMAIIADITERKRIEERLRASEDLYHQMFDHHSAVKLLLDPASGAIIDANLAAAEFYGYPLDTLRKMNIKEINVLPPDQVTQAYTSAWNHKQNYFIFSHRLASGELRDVEVYSVPIQTQERTVLYSIIHDITARRQAETQLRYLSTHDALTGLYNRALFELELARLNQSRDFPISIVVADVDDLKITNDTRGHAVGDELLHHVARVLQAACRVSDMIARIGGDEFAILLPNTDATTAAQFITRVCERLAAERFDGAGLAQRISIGVATAVSDNLETTFRLADAQMYANKRMRKSSRLEP